MNSNQRRKDLRRMERVHGPRLDLLIATAKLTSQHTADLVAEATNRLIWEPPVPGPHLRRYYLRLLDKT